MTKLEKQYKNRPRPYLSWSQLSIWERDPELYKRVYIDGEKQENIYLDFGRKAAEALEDRENPSKDKGLAFLQVCMPDYKKREYKIEAEFEGIAILGKLDGFNPRSKVLGEFKTGKKWTQRMADQSGQLTFYSALIWLKYGILPKKIFLHWAETRWENGEVVLTGRIENFETSREMKDVLLLYGRIERAWKAIKKLYKLNHK